LGGYFLSDAGDQLSHCFIPWLPLKKQNLPQPRVFTVRTPCPANGGSVLERGEKRDWLKVLIFAMKTHCKNHASISSQVKKTSLLINQGKKYVNKQHTIIQTIFIS